ncbi:hypothetical protein ACIA5D_05680 [Actinoplanes sp. NPDC051513]|uniref:hypothetical protein n=1 Tax=Actinoplanes sp. NPDC051513 TaxID=3363908 RepID=UPI0037A7D529
MAAIQFPNQLFGPGKFQAVVKDNNGAPSTVLEASKDFTVETEWRIDELSALLLGGKWTVTAYVESIGQGPERAIAAVQVLLNGGRDYAAVATVKAGTLPDNPAPPRSGVYKLVTVLTHDNFGKITNVAAVVEGPILRIG